MENDGGQMTEARRYRSKAARGAVRFWWQAFALLGLTLLLWCQVPVSAVLHEPHTPAPLPAPRASYVALAPGEAAQALAGMRSSWATAESEGRTHLDMGMFDLMSAEAGPPAFLDRGARYPGVWRPAEVVPLEQQMPVIGVPSQALAAGRPLVPQQGLNVAYSQSLAAAAFSFVPPDGVLPERRGECRFYLETDDDGAAVHVLLLSPASASSAVLGRALQRGRAESAARGVVSLMWSFPK
jgi:hypothetical protein